MLYDPRRSADPFALPSLIAWLECQPPETAYSYDRPCGCLLAQYFGAHGYARPYITRHSVNELSRYDTLRGFPASFDRTARQEPHTFGAALSRARHAMGAQQ